MANTNNRSAGDALTAANLKAHAQVKPPVWPSYGRSGNLLHSDHGIPIGDEDFIGSEHDSVQDVDTGQSEDEGDIRKTLRDILGRDEPPTDKRYGLPAHQEERLSRGVLEYKAMISKRTTKAVEHIVSDAAIAGNDLGGYDVMQEITTALVNGRDREKQAETTIRRMLRREKMADIKKQHDYAEMIGMKQAENERLHRQFLKGKRAADIDEGYVQGRIIDVVERERERERERRGTVDGSEDNDDN